MASINIADIINLLGWTLGLALYAMLLLMSLRSFGFTPRVPNNLNEKGSAAVNSFSVARVHDYDVLPLATAILGLIWNAGTLATHSLEGLGAEEATTSTSFLLLGAASVSALGFLPAVVVHLTLKAGKAEESRGADRRETNLLVVVAYTLSGIAAVMHFTRALTAQTPTSKSALYILTVGFTILMLGLFITTRREKNSRRAVWATALAVFAVSALHLSSGDGDANHERWFTELIGHHASLPLALAILYQDYRFAFADIFLKRALALLGFAVLTATCFGAYLSLFATGAGGANNGTEVLIGTRSFGVIIALWMGTGLLYPWLQQAARWFVDTIVLRRVDYVELRGEIARLVQRYEVLDAVLDEVCACLRPALTAREVTWRASSEARDAVELREARARIIVQIPTTEMPRYKLVISELAAGRRLLSDDYEMLEAVALIVARRIDLLRVTHERCEQVQREQEISKLATEAQLRALRAQVNPHFLFNALTTIGYLIQTSPERALSTLMRLTDLLRRVLRSTAEWVTLGEELRLVEAYLDIERARFEERLRVRVDVPEELQGLNVPSLIIQPLVENAIKHGIAPQRAGGEVVISARLLSSIELGEESENGEKLDVLSITVRDTGAGASRAQLEAGRRGGFGLANVEERLRVLCGASAELRIESAPHAGASVEIRLPVRLAQANRSTSNPDTRLAVTNGVPSAVFTESHNTSVVKGSVR